MGRGRYSSGKKWRSKVARVAKNVALRNQEQKSITLDLGAAGLYKDGGDTVSNSQPWSSFILRSLTSGVGAADVIGDEMTLKRFNLHLMFRNDAASQVDTAFRVMVGWLNPNVSSIGSNWRIGTGGDSIAAFIRTPLDQNTIWKKLLHDRVYTVNSIITAQNHMRKVTINLNMHNKKYMFDPVSKLGIHEDLVVLVTGSSATGTALTTVIGGIDGFMRIWYKDG